LQLIKEISKITQEKEELIHLISMIDYLKLSENKETASYVIPDNFSVFSLLNVPQKVKEEELVKMIAIGKESVLRIYKKSLFWLIISVKEAEEIQNKLKLVQFEDGKLKFDYLNRNGLIRSINKQIQTSNYHKEAHDLKAAGNNSHVNVNGNGNGNSIGNGRKNSNSNSNNKDRTNSEALSWRKKSNDQSVGLNSPKTSIE
jgi:hypothetical protein